MSKLTRSGSYWSQVERKRHHRSSRLVTTSRSRSSLKARLPTKAMRLISVDVALVDLEDDVDAVLVEADDLRLDASHRSGRAGIEIQDALPVGLRQRRGEDGARAQLQLGPQLLVGDLVVALEGDPVDDRVLDHLHDQRVALAARLTSWNRPVA